MIEQLRDKPAGYALAILIVGLATVLRLTLYWIPEGLTYIFFYPSLMVAATLAGFGPGMVATLLSTLSAAFFIMPPAYQFLPLTGPELMGLAGFFLSGSLMSTVAGLYHRALRQAISAHHDLADQQRITDAARQRAEALRESEENLRRAKDEWESTFNSVPDLIALIDDQYRIVRANRAMAERLGVEPEACVGQLCYKAVHGTAEPPPSCPHSQTILDHLEHEAEVSEERLGGEFLVTATPIRNATGEIIGTVHVARDITERKRAEEALSKKAEDLAAANEELEVTTEELRSQNDELVLTRDVLETERRRYRDLFDFAPEGYVVTDLGGMIREANLAATKFLGMTQEALIGKPLAYFTATEDHASFCDQLPGLQHETRLQWEVTLRSNQGTDTDTAINVSPVFDSEDRPSGLRWLLRDITERKQVEEALRLSEERYRTLFETLLEGFCIIEMVFDAHGKAVDYRFLEINPAFEVQTGLRDAKGRLIREMVPNTEAHWFEIYGNVALTGQPARYANEAKALNRWYDVLAYRVGGEESRRVGVLFNDITERKQAEEALARQARLLAAVQESTNTHLAYLDRDLRILRVNSAYCKGAGLSEAELLGHTPGEAFGRPKMDEEYRRILKRGVPFGLTETERPPEHPYDHTTWWNWLATPVKDDDGQIEGLVVSVTDVTSLVESRERLKALADSLQGTNQRLEVSNKDLEHFAYVASHDLQEPLRTVSSFARMLEKRYKDKLDQDANEFIEFITDGAERMQTLILDLLAYSRVGSQSKPMAPVESGVALDEALRALKQAISDSGVIVTRDPLPVVLGDNGQITQLFQNLIGNAIKFHREGIQPEVHISAREDGKFWIFRVADNGIGIDPKYHDKIFTIFQRLHSTERYKGTGIGLAICKRIIERHGGRIWVESPPSQGSAFLFTLPKAQIF